MKIKYLPNIITAFRIAATIVLMFMETFSKEFFVIYMLAGFSDVLDGWIARKTKNTSELGAKLDSMADLMYYAVMGVKIFPVLLKKLTKFIWIVLGLIFLVRIFSYGLAALKYGQLASLHTYMNKVTGGIVFLIPFVITTKYAVVFCTCGSIIALIASIEELLIHIRTKEYTTGVKTLFCKRAMEK